VTEASLAGHMRMLFEHGRWADARILAAAGRVSEQDYHAASPGLSFGSLHRTLVHQLVANGLWLSRWTGAAAPEFAARPGDPTAAAVADFARLSALWRETEEAAAAFYARITDATLAATLSYTNSRRKAGSRPLHELVAQVLAHGVQHRAESAVRLTALGQSPGDVDLIVYLRSR